MTGVDVEHTKAPEDLCDYCALMWRGWGGRGCCEECDELAPPSLAECTCLTIEDRGDTMSKNTFDREGEWEIKTTILCDGKAVGFIDALGPTYEFALNTVVTNLERREVSS